MSFQDLIVGEFGFSLEDYNQMLETAKKERISILHAVENTKKVEKTKLLDSFAKTYKIQSFDLKAKTIPENILNLVPKEIVQKYKIVPVDRAGNNIIIATADPENHEVIDTIRFKCGYFAKSVLASPADIEEALKDYYGKMDMSKLVGEKKGQSDQSLNKKSRSVIGAGSSKDDGPVVKLVNDVLIKCLSSGASDIHFESYEDYMRIRLRIDGSLIEIARPPTHMRAALISRVKIMAGLNIAETRLPQDGAINITIGEKPVDFRVNTLPTSYGEKIVMRILDKSNLQVDMTQLGLEEDQLRAFKDAIYSPFGMVLVTGPTGSGKTTTLYSGLCELNREDSNVMTAEDPVEYNISGINQVQMKAEIGLNFAASLRAFLRQDPDIIMVGEIRDLETAEIGIKAALTGHMVLSTLHTNSAPDTVSRLLNMGVAAFNLVAALKCITAQRLVKKICEHCKEVDPSVTAEILLQLGVPESFVHKVKAYKGAGCGACSQSGSKGRIAVHEVMIMTEEVKKSILDGDSVFDIKKIAMASGMRTLRQSALNKMVHGICSANEVVKVTSPDKDRDDT